MAVHLPPVLDFSPPVCPGRTKLTAGRSSMTADEADAAVPGSTNSSASASPKSSAACTSERDFGRFCCSMFSSSSDPHGKAVSAVDCVIGARPHHSSLFLHTPPAAISDSSTTLCLSGCWGKTLKAAGSAAGQGREQQCLGATCLFHCRFRKKHG